MSTEVILLQRIERLGQMGDVVKVKPGFARNFLLPQRKALRATKENLAFFEGQRKILEAQNLKDKQEAEKVSAKLDGKKVIIIRQAAEGGQLYGSVSARDIADGISASGVTVTRGQVLLNQAFKMIGLFPVSIQLHPEVKVQVTLNIARSQEEAAVQEKQGKALVAAEAAREKAEAEEAAAANKADVLEESALKNEAGEEAA